MTAQGGQDNAFTSYDYTAYYQRVAADRLELMMQMESDRMVNLRLTEEDILTERDVIIEERNQRTENSAGALFREQRMAAQYEPSLWRADHRLASRDGNAGYGRRAGLL